MLGAIVHHEIDNDATATAGATTGAVHLLGFDQPPLPARAPVLIELVERIVVNGFAVEVLRPLRVMLPYRVRGLVILFLQRGKELSSNMFFRPVAVPPQQAA